MTLSQPYAQSEEMKRAMQGQAALRQEKPNFLALASFQCCMYNVVNGS